MSNLEHARNCGTEGWDRGTCTCSLKYRIRIEELEKEKKDVIRGLKEIHKQIELWREKNE